MLNQNSILSSNTSGSGSADGDVIGPASSTDNAVVRYNGTTGKLVQNSTVTINDNGNVGVAGAITNTKYFVGGGGGANPGGLGGSKYVMDWFGGSHRSFSYGADTSTNGAWAWNSQRSDGSNGVAVMSLTSTGLGIGVAPSYQLQLSTDSAAKPSTNTWTIASDARIKTETGEYTKGLDAVLALRPVTYRYNGKAGMVDDGEDKISIIAQEAITAFPECVGSYMVKLEKDDKEKTEVLNWNGHALTFALVNAVKELTARIAKLENS